MIDEFFEWLFEEHPFIFELMVVVLLVVVVASGILELIKMWWFS